MVLRQKSSVGDKKRVQVAYMMRMDGLPVKIISNISDSSCLQIMKKHSLQLQNDGFDMCKRNEIFAISFITETTVLMSRNFISYHATIT